ncbi:MULTISPECIES: hypothetical protein [unclassified Paenibacillus]|nr:MULTISPECIES: hypothetical protein [unclassified Paenibacillus]
MSKIKDGMLGLCIGDALGGNLLWAWGDSAALAYVLGESRGYHQVVRAV